MLEISYENGTNMLVNVCTGWPVLAKSRHVLCANCGAQVEFIARRYGLSTGIIGNNSNLTYICLMCPQMEHLDEVHFNLI